MNLPHIDWTSFFAGAVSLACLLILVCLGISYLMKRATDHLDAPAYPLGHISDRPEFHLDEPDEHEGGFI